MVHTMYCSKCYFGRRVIKLLFSKGPWSSVCIAPHVHSGMAPLDNEYDYTNGHRTLVAVPAGLWVNESMEPFQADHDIILIPDHIVTEVRSFHLFQSNDLRAIVGFRDNVAGKVSACTYMV